VSKLTSNSEAAKALSLLGAAKGGEARAKSLSPEERSRIAREAVEKRWERAGKLRPAAERGALKATHKGSFKDDFGIDVECYVLNDERKTAVISQRGMAEALGFNTSGGNRFPRFIGGKAIAKYIGPELREKLEKPLIFQPPTAGSNSAAMTKVYGFDVTILIDVCNAITSAERDGALKANQANIAKQAHIIKDASAKAGIQGLVYALAGYNVTAQEVIEAFKLYVQEEAKKYESEFPNELYEQWYRLYEIPVPERGKPWHFKHLTVKHIYYPLAKSSGRILDLLRALRSQDGNRQKKLFQFLNDVGARALRMQLGRVLEMSESSEDRPAYERKIVERFGGQQELDFLTTTET
jgi:hypothetical protein